MILVQLEIPLSSVRHLAQMCGRHDVPLMLDPAPAQPLDRATLERTTWLTPNQTEARFYAGGDDGVNSTVARLLASGARNVILKRAEDGVMIIDGEGNRTAVPSFPVHAVDTTAAGDSFNGAFAVAILRGHCLADSARYAAAAAALTVTRNGAQSSLPAAEDVDQFLAASTAD